MHISHILQNSLECNSEARIAQIDFKAAFDRISHAGLIFKLKSIGVGGPLLSVLTDFLLNRRHYVVVDGCNSNFANVVSGVPQGSVLGPLLFILYTSDLGFITENLLVSYADDSTLIAVCDKACNRQSITDSLNCDLNVISEWCNTWGMVINPAKSKSMIVSRSRTINPVFS